MSRYRRLWSQRRQVSGGWMMCTTTAFRPRARMHGSSWEPGGGLLVALDHQGRRGGGVVTELLRYRRRIGVYVLRGWGQGLRVWCKSCARCSPRTRLWIWKPAALPRPLSRDEYHNAALMRGRKYHVSERKYPSIQCHTYTDKTYLSADILTLIRLHTNRLSSTSSVD
jgi:hypothetical protein